MDKAIDKLCREVQKQGLCDKVENCHGCPLWSQEELIKAINREEK